MIENIEKIYRLVILVYLGPKLVIGDVPNDPVIVIALRKLRRALLLRAESDLRRQRARVVVG